MLVRSQQTDVGGALLMALLSLLGLAAFGYPFLLPALPTAADGSVRSSDAPVIFAVLLPLLLVLLLAEISNGRLNSKLIAALGVLVAVNSVLRLPVGLGDSPTFFFLPILLGYVYGARFAFLHGALSIFVSALLTAGVGPWLPFQMLALGWLGMGAAGLRSLRLPAGSWPEIVALCGYSYIACLVFGALMNIYFWPFGGAGPLGWQPGLSLAETLQRYWAYYLIQSLAWDALRAVSTTALIALLGKPLLRLLRRFHSRFFWNEVELAA